MAVIDGMSLCRAEQIKIKVKSINCPSAREGDKRIAEWMETAVNLRRGATRGS